MNTISIRPGVPQAPTSIAEGAGSAERPAAAPAPVVTDRVSTAATAQLQSTVELSVSLAATEREARLRSLAQAVRSGSYHPSASSLADQILAEAELDARIAKALG